MKRYFILIILAVVFFSCDNSKDPFSDVNKSPKITVKKASANKYETEFVDSLKLNKQIYAFKYRIEDEEKLQPIIKCGDAHHQINIKDSVVYLKSEIVGECFVSLSVKDAFGEESKTKVKIITFDNLPPVANVIAKESNNILSPFERLLDFSGSHDKDEKFGGKIVEYEYRIDTQQYIKTKSKTIKHIFPQNGSYRIQLRVKDSDGVWSNKVTKRIIVQ